MLEDFNHMEPMKSSSLTAFHDNFKTVVGNFRNFLKYEDELGQRSKSSQSFTPYQIEWTDLDVCIEVNKRASCGRGMKYIPVIDYHEVSLEYMWYLK